MLVVSYNLDFLGVFGHFGIQQIFWQDFRLVFNYQHSIFHLQFQHFPLSALPSSVALSQVMLTSSFVCFSVRDIHRQLWSFQDLFAALKVWITSTPTGPRTFRDETLTALVTHIFNKFTNQHVNVETSGIFIFLNSEITTLESGIYQVKLCKNKFQLEKSLSILVIFN